MKKIIALLLIAMVCQSCDALRILTIMASVGKTTIVDPSSEETSYVDPIGAQFGVESEILEINEESSVSTGLNFSFQGADYVDPGITGTVKLSYFNVPFLYTYNFNKGFYAEAGIQPGFLISAKDKYNGESDNYRDYVNKFEMGLPLGGGYRLNDKISFGVRGTYGLTRINNSGDGNDHNLLLVALVRYNLALPQK